MTRKNITCNCPADDINCPAALAAAAESMAQNPEIKECPLHTQSASEKGLASPGSATSLHANGFTMVTTPTLPSLVTPNQFDKILTGDCRLGPSAIYKRCAEFSYTPGDSSACSQKPAECSDDNQYLGRSSEQ